MTSFRLSRRMSASINPRSTAAVRAARPQRDRQVGELGEISREGSRRLRARPSLPSILIGRPSTKPTAERSAASASTACASAVNLPRAMVVTPVANLRSGSQTATRWSWCRDRARSGRRAAQDAWLLRERQYDSRHGTDPSGRSAACAAMPRRWSARPDCRHWRRCI